MQVSAGSGVFGRGFRLAFGRCRSWSRSHPGALQKFLLRFWESAAVVSRPPQDLPHHDKDCVGLDTAAQRAWRPSSQRLRRCRIGPPDGASFCCPWVFRGRLLRCFWEMAVVVPGVSQSFSAIFVLVSGVRRASFAGVTTFFASRQKLLRGGHRGAMCVVTVQPTAAPRREIGVSHDASSCFFRALRGRPRVASGRWQLWARSHPWAFLELLCWFWEYGFMVLRAPQDLARHDKGCAGGGHRGATCVVTVQPTAAPRWEIGVSHDASSCFFWPLRGRPRVASKRWQL